MLSKDLRISLVNWTVLHSGHINRRAFIGLSEIADCERLIYERYLHGENANIDQHFRMRIGIEFEEMIITRLQAMGIYSPGETIELFDGIVQGHTDGAIKGDILEIKTVPMERYLPNQSKLPTKVFYQVQAYMHYLKRKWTHVVYVARDTGMIEVNGVYYKEQIGQKIEAKVGRLVNAVESLEKPECTCGRCNGDFSHGSIKV